MMKWNRTHRKGTKQPIIMSTDSGFWPSISWLEDEWWPYLERCKLKNTKPLSQEDYYYSQLR